ncbi:MAG TPA: hypothetical protein VE754_02410 [Actinomycetota bacterium]|jgi:hypothetical protein|nr:hypothetical protein [Actinomycetota bacterium]
MGGYDEVLSLRGGKNVSESQIGGAAFIGVGVLGALRHHLPGGGDPLVPVGLEVERPFPRAVNLVAGQRAVSGAWSCADVEVT